MFLLYKYKPVSSIHNITYWLIKAVKMWFLFYIDHTSMFSSHEKEVYDNLIRVVGSEMDTRIRQNMFLIKDRIFNKVNKNITQVSSGSLAEGLDLPEVTWM